MELTILIDETAKKIELKSVSFAKHGDRLFLAEPQHIDFFTHVKFNQNNECHERYLNRGLLFEEQADALLFSKSFIARCET